MVITRNRRLSLLISDDEWDMLQAVAEHAGVTASDWVRLRIREGFDASKKARQMKAFAEHGPRESQLHKLKLKPKK